MKKVYRIYSLEDSAVEVSAHKDVELTRTYTLELQELKEWWVDDVGNYGGGSSTDYETHEEAEAKLLGKERYGEFVILHVYIT